MECCDRFELSSWIAFMTSFWKFSAKSDKEVKVSKLIWLFFLKVRLTIEKFCVKFCNILCCIIFVLFKSIMWTSWVYVSSCACQSMWNQSVFVNFQCKESNSLLHTTFKNMKKMQFFSRHFFKNLVTSGDLKLVTSLVTSKWRSPEVTRKKNHAP